MPTNLGKPSSSLAGLQQRATEAGSWPNVSSLASPPHLILARLVVRTTPSKKFRNQRPCPMHRGILTEWLAHRIGYLPIAQAARTLASLMHAAVTSATSAVTCRHHKSSASTNFEVAQPPHPLWPPFEFSVLHSFQLSTRIRVPARHQHRRAFSLSSRSRYPATTADWPPDARKLLANKLPSPCRRPIDTNCERDCSDSGESVPHRPHCSYGTANRGDATPIPSRHRYVLPYKGRSLLEEEGAYHDVHAW
jgi:hypothetical protein